MPKPNFRYTHYDLKEIRTGTIIEVSLNAVANVRLMTAGNFQRFTELLDFKYVGGVLEKSPLRLAIPKLTAIACHRRMVGQLGRIICEDAAANQPPPSARAPDQPSSRNEKRSADSQP